MLIGEACSRGFNRVPFGVRRVAQLLVEASRVESCRVGRMLSEYPRCDQSQCACKLGGVLSRF